MTAAPAPPIGRRSLPAVMVRAPFRARAWRSTAQVVVGLPLALVAWTVVWTLLTGALVLVVTAVLAVPFLAALFACSRYFSRLHHARVSAFSTSALPAVPGPPVGGTVWARFWGQCRSIRMWRQIGYHAISGVTGTIGFVVVIGCWTAALMLTTVAAYAWSLPARVSLGVALHDPVVVLVLTVAGLLSLLLAPHVAAAAAAVDTQLLRAALSPTHSESLTRRVDLLSDSRAGVIDAADAERRRLERDLHDGTQQRLVSLAMNLGMMRSGAADLPEPVQEAIEQAHDEAKLALAELRDFVRGLHPAVLDDLGLDAALSGIAARSPVPVRIQVDLPGRLPRPVESVAYFVVSEALTNVAKHARATRADVVVELANLGLLRVVVSDDGRGDADFERGSGLRGLNQRVRAVDGFMTIDSPPGGPTILVAVLPCLPPTPPAA